MSGSRLISKRAARIFVFASMTMLVANAFMPSIGADSNATTNVTVTTAAGFVPQLQVARGTADVVVLDAFLQDAIDQSQTQAFDRVTFDLPATPSGRALSDAFSSIRITYKFAGIASEDLIAISRWDGTEWRFAPNELKAGATAVCTPDCAAPISFEFSTLAIEPDDLRADDAIRLRVYGSVPSSALVDTIVAVSIPVNGITFLTPALLPTGGTLDSTGPDNPYNAATLTVIQLLADFTIDGPDSVVAGTTVEYTLTGIDEFGDPYTFPGATGTESYTARTTPTGDETVSISRPGQGGTITRTMAITILPDVLDEILIDGPTTVVAGVEETYTHSGEDQYDNGVPLAVTSQTFLEIEARDDYQVTYSEAGKTGTLDVTVVAADLASILVDGPAELVVAETGTYTAAGFDEFDNDVVLGDLSFTVSRDCLAPPCVVTNEDGSFDVTAPTSVGALTVEITDADTGFVDSFEIPILAGPPSYLEIVADPDEITNDADDSTTITGWLRDEFGNDVDVADVAVTLDATSGSLDDTDLVTDDQGFFATTYRPDPADPTGYIATVSGTSDEVDVVSAEITVLDVRAPVLTTTTDGLDFFSPSLSPGVKDSVGGTLAVSEPSYLIVEVYDADDFFVATLIEVDLLSPGDVRDYSWDGLDDAGLPVPDGTYVLYLYAEDTGGLVDDEIRVVELDDTAPTFTGGPDRDTVGAGVVTLEFASTEVLDGLPTVLIARSDRADPETCDAGTLAVADDSGLVFTCDYTVVAGTADSMSIRVSGTDLAGNPGETEVGSFGLDFVAPGAISLDSILLANNAPPADDSVSGVAGSAEPGAEVCAVDAADEFDFACVTAGDDGSWGPIGIPDGTSRFGLVQTDAAGNRGSDATFVDIDTVGPEVLDIVVSNPFFSPTASVGVKDTSTLTFTAPGATGYFLVITDEDGADVLEYPESGLAAFPAEFEWDGADADGIVADGTYTVSIYAVDDGGNVGYGAAFFTVDDLAPEFSDVSVGPTPIDGVMYVDSAFFDVFAQIVDEHGLEAAYVDVGGALGSVTGFEPPAAVSFGVLAGDIVSEGPASVTIYALDLAGNAGSLTVDGLVVVDRTAPELVLATPSSRPAQLAAQELGVDASDTNLDTITLLATSDTLNILGLDKVAAGEFTVRFEAPTTTGLYAYKLQLADAAGNLAVPFDGTFEVTPADLASVELVGCSARVTETCALSARAFDAFGNEKASGVAFAFEITNADAGSVDADGLFTAGTLAGVFADALSVAGDDGSFIASAEGPATVLPGDLAEVVVSGDTTIVAGTTKAYSVSGRDAHGNDIALDPSSFEFIAPTAAGPASVRYPEPGSGLEGTLDVTVLADALASITVSGPASLEVGTTGTFALAGFDKYGNAVALAVPAKDFTAPETAGCGVLVTYTEAGITGSTSLCALAGPLASITIGGPASVVAGSTTDFPLSGADQYGNAVPVSPFVSFTAPTAVGTADVTHTESGVPGSRTVDVVAGPLATLVLACPETVQAGETVTCGLSGFDEFGNPTATSAPTVDLRAPDALGGGSLSYTEGGVTATFDVTVVTGPLRNIVVSGPDTMYIGETKMFGLAGFDAGGNPVPMSKSAFSFTAPSREGVTEASYTESDVTGSKVVEVLFKRPREKTGGGHSGGSGSVPLPPTTDEPAPLPEPEPQPEPETTPVVDEPLEPTGDATPEPAVEDAPTSDGDAPVDVDESSTSADGTEDLDAASDLPQEAIGPRPTPTAVSAPQITPTITAKPLLIVMGLLLGIGAALYGMKKLR